jgi:hypothetical protein
MRGDPKITGIDFYYFLFCIFINSTLVPFKVSSMCINALIPNDVSNAQNSAGTLEAGYS